MDLNESKIRLPAMVRLGANPQDQNKGATFLNSIQFSRFYLFFHVGHGGPIYCFTYGPVGIFPLSPLIASQRVYFRSIKSVSFCVFAQNLFAGSLVLIDDLCALKVQTITQEQLEHTGTKNLKIFGVLLQWLPSSTRASGIISEDTAAGLCADLPNESNLGKAKYIHWRKHTSAYSKQPLKKMDLQETQCKISIERANVLTKKLLQDKRDHESKEGGFILPITAPSKPIKLKGGLD